VDAHGHAVGDNADVNAAPDDSPAPRTIPEATFPGDTGEASAEVTAALAAYGAGQIEYAEALGVLQGARLLVPVVAVLGEVEYDAAGLPHDKTSDMATVLLTGRDGRTALLAFTGTQRLRAWNPEARPVPVAARLAAQSAIQDGADALVVDVAGPTTFAISGDDLTGLAAGWQLGRVGRRSAWIRPPED